MITLRTKPGDRVLELGCGENPNPSCQVHVDVRPGPNVDFACDFNQPLPIKDKDFDGIYSQFCLEHISWRNTKLFLSECFRILKPGGSAVFVIPNTEAQMEYIKGHPSGWENRDCFTSASVTLFGDLDYPENSHKAFFSPAVVMDLFAEAGFEKITTAAYGGIGTDMVVQAKRPESVEGDKIEEPAPIPDAVVPASVAIPTDPLVLFDKKYFNGGNAWGGYKPFYHDSIKYDLAAKAVLARRPESVLELGCGRGYVLKRLQDSGLSVRGWDISKHCYMTRATEEVGQSGDLTKVIWADGLDYDLCFSQAFLEHVPEDKLPAIVAEMERTCKRGLHGITFADDGSDKTRVTLKPKEWWQERLPRGHEVISLSELESGNLPDAFFNGDGKIKLNIGSFMTMHHHGWLNIDVHDLGQWATDRRYHFLKQDVHNGLPQGTETVDLILMNHFLEHLTYAEGLVVLKECRRVLKPGGAIRVIVPDAGMLTACTDEQLKDFGEVNDGCADSPTRAAKLWALIHEGHHAAYDEATLFAALDEAGLSPSFAKFRHTELEAVKQMLKETLDMIPCLSLTLDATPKVN